MAAASSILLGSAILGGAYSQSQGMRAQGDFQRRQSELNSRFAGMQAEDASKRGEKDAGDYMKKVKGMAGSQRAALAAQGIDVTQGSAADIQAETLELGARDAQTIRNNAFREAWGYRVQAAGVRAQGEMAQIGAYGEARNTMLSGAVRAAALGADSFGGGGTPKSAGTGTRMQGDRGQYITDGGF